MHAQRRGSRQVVLGEHLGATAAAVTLAAGARRRKLSRLDPLEQLERRPAPQRPVLPRLSQYLAFIHYFGFSIEPAESGLAARYLSLRAAQQWPAAGRLGSRSKLARRALAGLKTTVKWLAISLTSFLAINHTLVLCEYMILDKKQLAELILELRLVITKFSALLFVLSWHFRQSQVRKLVRQVKSSSIYVLGSELERSQPTHEPPQRRKHSTSGPLWRNTLPIDSLVGRWWLMGVAVTALHFGLSEWEVLSSEHLWLWLDDYSLHTLNNGTTSRSTLVFLSTLDNYIYTVHVYGTRLVGASVICIVCSLQTHNIKQLRCQVEQLIQSYAGVDDDDDDDDDEHDEYDCERSGAKHNDEHDHDDENDDDENDDDDDVDDEDDDDDDESCDNASEHSDCQSSGRKRSYDADRAHDERSRSPARVQWARVHPDHFFVLGRSDWARVEAWLAAAPAVGFLSGPGGQLLGRLAKAARGAWARASARVHSATPAAGSRAATPEARCGAREPWAWPRQSQSGPTRAGRRRRRRLRLRRHSRLPTEGAAEALAGHLERLAAKYELVRTVNERVNACFGPMLLVQFSALSLMSCIDVVYFSQYFSFTNQTKFIIMSGMVLLWWPYLLLYRFASDVEASSLQLLDSVRRLARLALVCHNLQLESTSLGGAQLASHQRPAHMPTRSLLARSLLARLEARLGPGAAGERVGVAAPDSQAGAGAAGSRLRIVTKLDYAFKPTSVSIMDVMTIDKFFLLDFAKIVITASVMIIQFIS